MAHCTTCNVCEQAGTLHDALEKQIVPCNVSTHRDASFTVWRCKGCRSLHCAEDADLALFYSDYPGHNVDSAEPTRDLGCRNKLSVLRRERITPQYSILDYGCGG